MGFMDKVKAQAEQALSMAQQGVAQGQEKLDSLQTKRSADGLLRDLGAAFYAQQRTGGSGDAVQTALAALDRHAAEQGAVDTTPAAPSAADADGVPATPSATPGQPAAPTPPAAATTAPPPSSNPPPTFNPPPSFNPPPTFDPPSQG